MILWHLGPQGCATCHSCPSNKFGNFRILPVLKVVKASVKHVDLTYWKIAVIDEYYIHMVVIKVE